jgi:hypothetical protein
MCFYEKKIQMLAPGLINFQRREEAFWKERPAQGKA